MQDRASTMRVVRSLFPPATRVKLVLSFIGSIVVSLIETGSLLLLLPLLDLLGGGGGSAITRRISELFGQPSHQSLVIILVIAVLGGFIAKDAFTLWYRWWAIGFTNHLQVSTSARMLGHLLRAPYEMHLRRSMADMMRAMYDAVSQFYSRTVNGLLGAVTEALTIITVMAALILLMPVQTLFLLAYFGLAALAFLRLIRPRIDAAAAEQLEASRAAFEATIHSLGGIKEIKIRHSQPHFLDRFRHAAQRSADASRVTTFLSEAPKYLLEILFIVGLGVMILTTSPTSAAGGAMGSLALLAAASFRVLPSATRLMANINAVRAGEPARQILFDELAEEDKLESAGEHRTATALLPFEHEIRFENVGFTYPDATEPVLNDVSFSIPAGTSFALVGGSGAGKTTLANLLLGLHKPTSGRILVDGVDIAEHMAEWQNNIAFVPQDVFHMDLPFSVNIAFDQYEDQIDRVRLAEAIQQAQLDDVVDALPRGLATTIGDRGIRLSGGQRQRIGIARALYRSPRLLVLDEATSALDNETERRITDTINSLHGRLTIVVIAHRLSTVKDADTIVMMDHGRVTALGTFGELTASSPEFAQMVELGSLGEAAAASPDSQED